MIIAHFHKLTRCIIFCILLSSSFVYGASEWHLLQPLSGKKSKLKVKGKSRSYWELQHDTPVVIEIEGPTELKIYTRAAIIKKRLDVLYGFVALRDNDERYFIGRGSSREKGISNPMVKGQRIAESRSVIFDVPAGTHQYKFTLPKQVKSPVFVRFLVPSQENVEKNTYIAYLPRKFLEEIRIDVKEKEYIYYRSDSENPIELEVIGPTRIRGIARLEFDHSIRGDKQYRVQIEEAGKIIATYPIIAKVSGTATYTAPSDKIPARGENIYLDVPEGKHLFKVLTPDPGISILFRFYIPMKDLGNEFEKEEGENANILGFTKFAKEG